MQKLQKLQKLQIDPWDGHAEQLLFSCLCSKVTISKPENLKNLQIVPWDMLNNFCFHVYAQKSLFIGENDNVYF